MAFKETMTIRQTILFVYSFSAYKNIDLLIGFEKQQSNFSLVFYIERFITLNNQIV